MVKQDFKSKHGVANQNSQLGIGAEDASGSPLPPIIMDAKDSSSIQLVFEYLKQHSEQGNLPAAEEECRRLAPFFDAYSRRLLKPANDDIPVANQDLFKPGALSGLFMAAAEKCRNTILSSVMILPSKFVQDNIFCSGSIHTSVFEANTSYNSKSFNFGFLQVFSKDSHGRTSSSVGLPLLSLDRKYMHIIRPHGGDKLLSCLQKVTTFSNHDMLHHFTSQIINNDIAKKIEPVSDKHVWSWYNQYITKTTNNAMAPLEYEGWAVQSHVRTWKFMDSGLAGQEMRDSIDAYLDQLQAISEALKSDDDILPYKKHALVDYFGMAMALMMTRLIPLTDPYFDHYFERLQSIDPAPQNTVVNLLKGKEIMRLLCDRMSQQEGQENAGRIKLVEIMMRSGIDRKNIFYRTLFSLKLISGTSKDELSQIEDSEFMRLLKGELDSPYTDGVFLERLDWDVRDFVNYVFSYDLPGTHNQLAQIAQDNLGFLLKVRRDRVVDSINRTEGKVVGQQGVPRSGVRIFNDYGFDTMLRKDYASIKKLQICCMVPTIVYPHAVPDDNTGLDKAQKQLDRQDSDMLRAVAKDMGFKP